MKANFLLIFFLYHFLGFSQVQLGSNINGEADNDLSGSSISISNDGSIVAIGALSNSGNGTESGHVRVYQFNGSNWIQLGNDIDGEASFNFSGIVSLSGSGSIVAIGAHGNSNNGSNSGHVRIFEYNGSNWIQLGSDINGENIGDASGEVSLSDNGNIVAIGASGNSGNGTFSGHARVFQYDGNDWVQLGSDIDGEASFDRSGSVSLSSDGTRLAIGASENDGNGADSGHVRIFEYDGNNWIQLGNDIDGEASGDQSHLVSLSDNGSRVAIGAPYNDANGIDSGHVRIYEFNGSNWIQMGSDIDGLNGSADPGMMPPPPGDSSAICTLSSDGNIVAIGAPFYDSSNGNDSGYVRIFQFNGSNWIHKATIDGEAINNRFGASVSLSSDGNKLAIGAPNNDGGGSNRGNASVYDLSLVLNTKPHKQIVFDIYPNPVSNKLNLDFDSDLELENIHIYNTLGQHIFSAKTSSVNVNKFSKGVYYVEIETKKGKATKKIIIE